MATPNKNFKAVLACLGISNAELAKALDYDPSLISRYLSGHRVFKAASRQMDAISDYILSRAKRMQDIDWLKAQFAAAGLPTDVSTVFRLKQNLIMWLASDGETLRNNLGRSLPGDIAGASRPPRTHLSAAAGPAQNSVTVGNLQLVLALRPALSALPQGAAADLFLSSDRLATAADADMAALLRELISTNDLHINMVVCVSGDTQAMSKLLDCYLEPLISGHVRLSVVHGTTQAVTGTLHILLPGGPCFLIQETLGGQAPPVAMIVRDADFVAETQASFAAAARYALPVVNIYGDECTRDMLDIFAIEYCTPGGLDVVKDSINPLFMTAAAYDRFLQARGHTGPEFAWRSAEFARFRAGLNGVLRGGSPFREILSLSRLNDIARRGRCRMAGLYFFEQGYVDLDAQGCLDVLLGYIDLLANEPNFSLRILDDLPELHGSNCWHLKRDGHLSINNWQGRSPVMVCSDQILLLREFQARYDALWAGGTVGSRANVISILRDVAARLAAAAPAGPSPLLRPDTETGEREADPGSPAPDGEQKDRCAAHFSAR